MENLEPNIRNAVRALIVRDGCVLLLKKDGGGLGERYALPGGAQDTGETLIQALDRECQEEIGTSVEIGELLYVADYFKPRDTIPASTRHLVEFLFSCNVPASYTPVNGYHPDKHQIEVVWVSLEDLEQITLLPKSVAGHLRRAVLESETGYLGAIG